MNCQDKGLLSSVDEVADARAAIQPCRGITYRQIVVVTERVAADLVCDQIPGDGIHLAVGDDRRRNSMCEGSCVLAQPTSIPT